jgi:hypothetical protein
MIDEVHTKEDGAFLDGEKIRADGLKSINQDLPPGDTDVLLMTEQGWRIGLHDTVTWVDSATSEVIYEPEIYAWAPLRHVNDYLVFSCQHNKCKDRVPGNEVHFSKGVGAVCEECWKELGHR